MWDDVEIVNLEQAKAHARITSSDEDDDLTLKLRQAHALVLDYVADSRDDDFIATMQTWDDTSAPAAVQAAIMRQFADLARFRGDDDVERVDVEIGNFLSPRVKQLLLLYRTPTIA